MIKERNDKTTSNIIYTSAFKELYNMYFDEKVQILKSYATNSQKRDNQNELWSTYTLLKHRQSGIKDLNA